MDKQFFTRKEAANILGVKPNTIYAWEKKNKISPSLKIGNKPRYTVEDLTKVVTENKKRDNG